MNEEYQFGIERAENALDWRAFRRWLRSIWNSMANLYRRADSIEAGASRTVQAVRRMVATLDTRLRLLERDLSSRLSSVKMPGSVPADISSALTPSFDVEYNPSDEGYTLRTSHISSFTRKSELSIPFWLGFLESNDINILKQTDSDKGVNIAIESLSYLISDEGLLETAPWLPSNYELGGVFYLEMYHGSAVLPNFFSFRSDHPVQVLEVQYYPSFTHYSVLAETSFSSSSTSWSIGGTMQIASDNTVQSDDSSGNIGDLVGNLRRVQPVDLTPTSYYGVDGLTYMVRVRAKCSDRAELIVRVSWMDSGNVVVGSESAVLEIEGNTYRDYECELFPPSNARKCIFQLIHKRVSPRGATLNIKQVRMYEGFRRKLVDHTATTGGTIPVDVKFPSTRTRIGVCIPNPSVSQNGNILYRAVIRNMDLEYRQYAQMGELYIPKARADGIVSYASIIVQGDNLENSKLKILSYPGSNNPVIVPMQKDGLSTSISFYPIPELAIPDTVQVEVPLVTYMERFTSMEPGGTLTLSRPPFVNVPYIRRLTYRGIPYDPNVPPTDLNYWVEQLRNRRAAGTGLRPTFTHEWEILSFSESTGISGDYRVGVIANEWIGVISTGLAQSAVVGFSTADITYQWFSSSGLGQLVRAELVWTPGDQFDATSHGYVAFAVLHKNLTTDTATYGVYARVSGYVTVNGTKMPAQVTWVDDRQATTFPGVNISYAIIQMPSGIPTTNGRALVDSISLELPMLIPNHLYAVSRFVMPITDTTTLPPVSVTAVLPDIVLPPDTVARPRIGDTYYVTRERLGLADSSRVDEYLMAAADSNTTIAIRRTENIYATKLYPILTDRSGNAIITIEKVTYDSDNNPVYTAVDKSQYTVIAANGLIEMKEQQPADTILVASYRFKITDERILSRWTDVLLNVPSTRNMTDYVHGQSRHLIPLELEESKLSYHPVLEYTHKGRKLKFATEISDLAGIPGVITVSYLTTEGDPELSIEMHYGNDGPPVVRRVLLYMEEIA